MKRSETIRKARKSYECDTCGKFINKGESYLEIKERGPKYEMNLNDPTEDGNQVGIQYSKYRVHLPELNCSWPDECKKGNHIKETYTDTDLNSTTCGQEIEYCVECGYSKLL